MPSIKIISISCQDTLRPGELLVETFFGDGGQELQISVLDAAKLRRAQQDRDRYRDLVVRVAGLNARFVELSAAEQEELIRRAEAASGEMAGVQAEQAAPAYADKPRQADLAARVRANRSEIVKSGGL